MLTIGINDILSFKEIEVKKMATSPSSEKKDKTVEPPAPEALKPQSDGASPPADTPVAQAKVHVRPRHGTYRPSHKATFVALAVVVAILALNAGVIVLVLKSQNSDSAKTRQSEVTLSPAALEGLGVSKTPVGNLGTELVVGPNSRFNGKVTVGGDVGIAGQLKLNSKFSAADASLAKLEAGETSLGQLNVNGDGTATNLNLRRDLSVAGVTRLQGPVTMSQLLTVNNSLNVAGNLAIGGTLSARSFQASSLVSDTTLTIGGHIITRGSAPGLSRGAALAATDTISNSGSDAAGTVAVNIGAGAPRSGILAQVSFHRQYGHTPRVVVTAVGRGVDNLYINRNSTGFSIGVDSISSGGYAFDYIIMQ